MKTYQTHTHRIRHFKIREWRKMMQHRKAQKIECQSKSAYCQDSSSQCQFFVWNVNQIKVRPIAAGKLNLKPAHNLQCENNKNIRFLSLALPTSLSSDLRVHIRWPFTVPEAIKRKQPLPGNGFCISHQNGKKESISCKCTNNCYFLRYIVTYKQKSISFNY